MVTQALASPNYKHGCVVFIFKQNKLRRGKAHVDSGEAVLLNMLHVAQLGFPNANAFLNSWQEAVVIRQLLHRKGDIW